MTQHLHIRCIALAAGTIALIIAASLAHGEDAPPPLNATVAALIAKARLRNANVGVSVRDVKTGAVVCAIDDSRLLIPASNVKLVTTGVALLVLGAEFQFTTNVYAAGTVDAARALDGDIVVVASGDPAISGREHGGNATAVFDAWAAEIAKSISSVRGNLVIDDNIFDRQYVHPSWPADQLSRWYCAPVSAFALNDNCIDVSVRPGARAGDPARVILEPPTNYFKIVNRCTTVATGNAQAAISRSPTTDTLIVTGTLTPKSAGASACIALVDPTLFAATVLRERLERAGVRIDGKILIAENRMDTSGMTLLASTSHSLVSAIRTANKRSQNFYAEMMLKTLGRQAAVPSSFEQGVKVVAKQLAALGFKPDSFRMADGSGMSRDNAFSASQLSEFLRHMATSEHGETFVSSLAASGEEGTTLRRRMTAPALAGKVLGKTGHLRGASALSGYVKSGEKFLAFSIIVNGEPLDAAAADRLEDSICQALVELAR